MIIAEDEIDVDVPVWYVDNSRRYLAALSAAFYGDPSKKFKLIGVTGTNGKTTITYLIKSILETAGKSVGIIGTNQNIIGDKVLVTKSTTPTSLGKAKVWKIIPTCSKRSSAIMRSSPSW